MKEITHPESIIFHHALSQSKFKTTIIIPYLMIL